LTTPTTRHSTPESDIAMIRKQASDYAMALDLVAKMSRSDTESQAVEDILEIFTALFAPQKLCFFSLRDGQPGEIYSPSSLSQEEYTAIQDYPYSFPERYAWTESTNGFLIKIHHRRDLLGLVIVDAVSFPEYKTHYLNLALSIADLCGLAIENARKTELLVCKEQNLRQEKEKLEQALAEVKTLSGLLPICMHCKKIRDDKGYWNQIETYISQHSSAEFSHGICQDCVEKYYPGLEI